MPVAALQITPDQLGNKGDAVVLDVSKLTGVPVRTIVRELQNTRYVASQAIPVAEFVPVLLDIDHSPEHFLNAANESFYTADGLALVRSQIKPGGRFAL